MDQYWIAGALYHRFKSMRTLRAQFAHRHTLLVVSDIIERDRILQLTRAAGRIAPLGRRGIRDEREAPAERGEKLRRLWGAGRRCAEGGERGAVSGGDGRVQGVDVGHLELSKVRRFD